MHTTQFPLAEDTAASALVDTWISPMHPMPGQLSVCQSRNDPVATGCKHAYYLERMFLFLEVLRPMHVGFISKFSSSAGG